LFFLQALETQNYRVLPPPFYIRGFIKTYSTYLGLDARQTVQIFDEMLETDSLYRLAEHHAPPSADSGGGGASFSTSGLSQGEARMVEASNERLNVTTMNPKPVLPVGFGSADSSGESRALMRIEHDTTTLRASDKYILKPTMLPSTKGTFYMPNFIPAVLVAIIVLAACLLVYRGLTTQPKTDAEDATATITASSTNSAVFGGSQTNPTPTLSSGILTRPPFLATVAAAQTGPSSSAKATTTTAANASPTAQPTTAPTPIQVVPSPTAVAATVKVDVIISGDTSWLDITVDGDKKVSKLATSGENFSFEGGKIAVRAGKPGAVKILVNGTEREYTKPNAGIITHTWFADGHDVIE
jgi:cytoskeletal protein RodZ